MSSANANCAEFGPGYEVVEQPWTVPGFVPPSFDYANPLERAGAPKNYFECRDSKLPYIDDVEQVATNLSLTASNPIPDGLPRDRRLTIVDGMMVDAEVMYMLVRETFELKLGGGATKQFVGYGLVIMRRNRVSLKDDDFVGTDFTQDTRFLLRRRLIVASFAAT